MAADQYTMQPRATFGLGAVLAFLAAVGSYFSTCSGHPWWGLGLAIVAMPLGAIGLMQSASARVKGGPLSMLAVLLGVVGVGLAIAGIALRIVTWPFR
jgi:hypothetical protein